MEVCPCKRAVPLDWSTKDTEQAQRVFLTIELLGEWSRVTLLGGKTYRVSRRCIAYHGVTTASVARDCEEVTDAVSR